MLLPRTSRTITTASPVLDWALTRIAETAIPAARIPCCRILPTTLRATDLWVTDQREVDVRLRDGGEHLGRIWMVSFLDVATDKVCGSCLRPVLSSDVVMVAATMAISLCGVPRAVHMDLGKEFDLQSVQRRDTQVSGETLYRAAKGLWGSLGVRIVKAIGRNPKTKTDERWHQIITDQFDKRFPGYCGSNTDERPEKLKG